MTVLDSTEIEAQLIDYPEWSIGDDGFLQAEFKFKGFSQAMLFVNAVAHIANVIDHHPNILIHDYFYVTLFTQSHDVGGITRRDFRLIKQVSALPRSGPK